MNSECILIRVNFFRSFVDCAYSPPRAILHLIEIPQKYFHFTLGKRLRNEQRGKTVKRAATISRVYLFIGLARSSRDKIFPRELPTHRSEIPPRPPCAINKYRPVQFMIRAMSLITLAHARAMPPIPDRAGGESITEMH